MKKRFWNLSGIVYVLLSFSVSSGNAYAVKIMPVGDSITRGGGYPVGALNYPTYRYYLYNSLAIAGIDVDYVGPYNGVGSDFAYHKPNPDTYVVADDYQDPGYSSFPDQDMAGDTGWQIDKFLESGVLPADKLVEDYDPDYVLLHLGTNNLGTRNDTPEQAIDKMGQLIDLLRSGDDANSNKETKIYVAQIIPLLDNAYEKGPGEFQLVKDFNAGLPVLIEQKNLDANHPAIVLVDIWSHFVDDQNQLIPLLLAEGTHPSDLGDREMAAGWYAPLASDLNIVPIPGAADGDLAPWDNPDGQINAADVLIALQLALGLRNPGTLQYVHGDMNTDGSIDVGDLILIIKTAM